MRRPYDFAAKGLAGARVNEIARRARISKRMLYHYFGDKEALWLAVLEEAYLHIRGEEQNSTSGVSRRSRACAD